MLKKISLGYFFILLFAASLNYIPGLTDTEGRVFGIFALDIFDDSLHVASALWALIGALYSQRSAKMFLIVFGVRAVSIIQQYIYRQSGFQSLIV